MLLLLFLALRLVRLGWGRRMSLSLAGRWLQVQAQLGRGCQDGRLACRRGRRGRSQLLLLLLESRLVARLEVLVMVVVLLHQLLLVMVLLLLLVLVLLLLLLLVLVLLLMLLVLVRVVGFKI